MSCSSKLDRDVFKGASNSMFVNSDIAKRIMGKNIKFGPGGVNTMDL